MSAATVMSVLFATGAVVAAIAAGGLRCNLRQLRTARAAAPLDGVDLSTAAIVPGSVPPGWPVPAEVGEPRVAAGYAALADDRAIGQGLIGDALTLFAGGVVGVAISSLRDDFFVGVPLAVLALTMGFGGYMLRSFPTVRWQPIEAAYRRRYAELTAEPLPPPPRRRRGLLGSLFGGDPS